MSSRTIHLQIKIVIVCVASVIVSTLAQAALKPNLEERMVPVSLDGEQVRLAVRIYRPDGAGPFPTLIFHHGSTGRGTNPKSFALYRRRDTLINYFVDRGWSVVLPSRRGRGGSEGLYDEGFIPSRERYCFQPDCALSGAERALADIDAITNIIRTWPFVDKDKLVIGSQSRGGILSIAHAGERPNFYRGVINFVGGWVSDRGRHRHRETINHTIFNHGATFGKETLWLYASGDRYYSLETTRASFAAYKEAGGKGVFADDFPDGIGHGLWRFPEDWGPVVEEYINRLGLKLKKSPSAIRFTPNPELSASALIGNWEGYFGYRPVGLRIHDVSSGQVNGEYIFRGRGRDIQEQIEKGVFGYSFPNGASIEFFLGNKDVIIATFYGRSLSRAVLYRVDN